LSKHTVVWIDQKEARIFRVEPDAATESTVHAPHFVHRHPGESDRAKDHPDDARRFFQEVARTLLDAEGIIIVGPSSAKLEFIKYVHKHDHLLEPKIIGVETMDHPTDAQIVAYAKEYFNLGGRTPAP
jgi:stalled ribosome rescue protein Dom34